MPLTQQDKDTMQLMARLTVAEALTEFRDVAKDEAQTTVKLHAAECSTKRQFWQDRNRMVGMIILAGGLGGALVTGLTLLLRLK